MCYARLHTGWRWLVTTRPLFLRGMKRKILFVCLGNICRSPLAEAIFKHKIAVLGLDNLFEADSCGTANYHIGQEPDPRTLRNATKNGVSIRHRGRQLVREDFRYFDHIFVMDQSNLQNALRLAEATTHHKVRMMRFFDPLAPDQDVPDPYYGNEADFQEVFDILDRSIDGFIKKATADF